jgi:hypothetical protein
MQLLASKMTFPVEYKSDVLERRKICIRVGGSQLATVLHVQYNIYMDLLLQKPLFFSTQYIHNKDMYKILCLSYLHKINMSMTVVWSSTTLHAVHRQFTGSSQAYISIGVTLSSFVCNNIILSDYPNQAFFGFFELKFRAVRNPVSHLIDIQETISNSKYINWYY